MMKKSSRPTSSAQPTEDTDERGWAQMGAATSQVLGMTKRGDRERVIAALAMTYGAYPNKIWKAGNAHTYVSTQVKDPSLADALLGQPLTLVDLLALWAKHDAEGAEAAAKDVVAGLHTFRSLQEAERNARPVKTSTLATRTAAWREAAASALLAGPARGYDVVSPPRTMSVSPADFWLRRRKVYVGVQVVGPFHHPRDYNRMVPARVFASLGISYIGHEAWIVLPQKTAGERYTEIAERVAPGVLKVIELAMPAYADL